MPILVPVAGGSHRPGLVVASQYLALSKMVCCTVQLMIPSPCTVQGPDHQLAGAKELFLQVVNYGGWNRGLKGGLGFSWKYRLCYLHVGVHI